MRYIPHTEADVRQMLDTIGVPDIAALFATVPEAQQIRELLDVPAALSEQELGAELAALAARNASSDSHDWFLGAGTYAHFTPSAVDALVSRSEFTTSYTPYQAEISQGTLQAIFEWQTMMSSLTGMEVANASMYDGASATAEAALMAMRVTRRSRVVLSQGTHPHTRDVLRTYLSGLENEIIEVGLADDGCTADALDALDEDAACLIVQQPNFLGCVEDVRRAAERAQAVGALCIVVVSEALSLALLEAPGAVGADIVCGEAQSFGVPMSFGGPHVGFLAGRQRHVRQMPGRLVGETVDSRGLRGFVLTLSTREQHIRRERATSNICTNQGLCLLMATIYLSLLGRRGLRRLAEMNLAKAAYARERVAATAGVALCFESPVFNEFAVRVPDSGRLALERALAANCVGGLDLATAMPELGAAVLVCTTELASRDAIDRLIAALAGASP